jgi:hypothetical protein
MTGPFYRLWLREKGRTRGLHHHNNILRKELAISKALAEHRGAELLDARSRITRLENNMDFLVSGRLARMDAEGPA